MSNNLSDRLSLGFSCAGHTYSHLFAPIFYIVALALEDELGLSHGELIALMVAGNVMFGLVAPLAGWLGDRWSSTGMMGIYFIGTGAGMVMTGLAATPAMIALWLAVTGLFASIYHPVGIAWLLRHAEKKGMALGVNGVFGALGPGLAAILTGFLVDFSSWRLAFMIPGAVIVATGFVFYVLIARGLIIEAKTDRAPDQPASRHDRVRAYLVLLVTILCTGLIYQATQSGLPKVFSVRMAEFSEGGVLGASTLVAVVYFFAGGMQLLGGYLADRCPLKVVYLTAFALQVPLLLVASSLGGPALVVVIMIMISTNTGVLPAENRLLARYTPSHWRGFAFGMKFIIQLGLSGALGILMEGALYD
ncbi:MAG: MFS transporter, partial [Rhodospirillales bacterium]